MPTETDRSPADLDALLEALDHADAGVRALYLRLADDPDVAPEHEARLRELQRKRLELAHQVGVAALVRWRGTRETGQASLAVRAIGAVEPDAPAPSEPEPAIATAARTESVEAPPPPSSEAPIDAPAPVSAARLEEFKAAFSAPASTPRIAPRPDDRTLLLALARHVTLAEEVSTSGALEHEVESLERATSEERQRQWREMSREARVRWLSLMVAWAKALEEDALRLQEPTTPVTTVFRSLRSFSIDDNPGFVHGFARAARPRWGGTWRMDALYHLREVVPEPAPVPPKPAVPAAKRKAAAVEESRDDEAPEDDDLAGWPYLERVKGLRVVLLGGEVREERRAALERAFQFDSLEWVPTDRPRLVASLAERAERGSVDIILVTKFASHGGSVAIQKSSKAPFLTMRHGYGVTTVRQVLEEYFSRDDDKASGKGAKRRSG